MKKSVKYRLPIIIAVFIVAALGVYFIVNNIFFEKFYMSRKQSMLEKSFYEVKQTVEEGNPADILSGFEKLMTNSGISVILLDSSGGVITSSTTNVTPLRNQFFEAILSSRNDENLIVRTKDYFIQRLSDSNTGTDYMVLCGSTEDNEFIMLRVTIESIRENVGLSNTFQAYIIIVLSIICVVVVFVVTRLKAANAKLSEDIKEKIEIDDMRKEFLANVSHELKTPIALIQGYAEGLKEGVASDEESRAEYCDVIIDESAKMNNMVRQLLNLTRLESGTESLSMENFDITELLKSRITAFEIKARQLGVYFILGNDEPCIVCSDPSKVEEVIDNYISNAIDHASGEKRIDVSFTVINDKLRVNVFNTGEPIPEEALEKVWIKLYKVDKSRNRQFGGFGLGLSIVKAIMEELGNGYGVENCSDGVVFWFELDRAK
ncbi:MAG: hypothetical protein IK152_05430 [Lachnospiraceae bacterium]|nr:hypothetical protein [Lachnospiraceae bacterium]